jgi:hypothetical protein
MWPSGLDWFYIHRANICSHGWTDGIYNKWMNEWMNELVTSCWTPWPSSWRIYIPPKHWDVFWTTQHYNPDAGNLHSHSCENQQHVIYKNARLIVIEGLNEFNLIQLLTEFLNMLKAIFNRIWNHKTHTILFFYRIPANLRSLVFCTALKHGGEEDWNFLWERYQESIITTEQVTILSALGCTKNESLLQQ